MKDSNVLRRVPKIFSDTSNLSSLVLSICSGDYTESELNQFVDLMHKISLSYLRYQKSCGKEIGWRRQTYSGELEDLALDCIAGLFRRNENGDFIQIQNYFGQNANLDDLDDTAIIYLTKRLVIKKTKQELARIFKERDPHGARIARNVRIAVNCAADFSSFTKMGKEYIFSPNGSHQRGQDKVIRQKIVAQSSKSPLGRSNGCCNASHKATCLVDSQPCIPERSLRIEYMRVYCPRDSVSTCIKKMLRIVSEDDRYQNYIPLDMVNRVLRQSAWQMTQHQWLASRNAAASPLDEFKWQEIALRKARVQKKIEKKIQTDYVQKGKISTSKGMIYVRAIEDLLEDIGDGRKPNSHFTYLKTYLRQLTQEAYRMQERTVFEYLAKITKRWFRNALMELLGDTN
ncbi:MAG: hypothetical protein ACE5G1_04755 [bacterium]